MNNLNPSRKLAAPPRAHFFLAQFLLVGLMLAGTVQGQSQDPDLAHALYKNPNAPIPARVEDLLARMTLAEKVAQLRVVWQAKTKIFDSAMQFDPAKAALGQDPSYPAFWLPFQDMTTGNHIAQWSSQVPRGTCSGTGMSTCQTGEACVNGACTPISSL